MKELSNFYTIQKCILNTVFFLSFFSFLFYVMLLTFNILSHCDSFDWIYPYYFYKFIGHFLGQFKDNCSEHGLKAVWGGPLTSRSQLVAVNADWGQVCVLCWGMKVRALRNRKKVHVIYYHNFPLFNWKELHVSIFFIYNQRRIFSMVWDSSKAKYMMTAELRVKKVSSWISDDENKISSISYSYPLI